MNLERQLSMSLKSALKSFVKVVQLIRAISLFSLILIGTVDSKMKEKRCGTLLEILSESGWVSTATAEKATKEHKILLHNNPLSAKFIKWSNTLKQIVGKLPTICLSVFDHFSGLAFKGIKIFPRKQRNLM